MSVSDSGIKGDRAFPPTATSMFRGLRDADAPEYARRLRQIVELYWKPVYCVIRHSWVNDNQAAKDLTQDFFASHVLAGKLLSAFQPDRGSFRSLLRTALLNFLRGRAREERRPKHGGGAEVVNADSTGDPLDGFVPESEDLSPEQLFDSAWNHAVVTRAVERLEVRLRDEGRASAFEVFRRYDLEEGREQGSYADIGRELGLTPAQVRHALEHARAALEEIIVDLARDYVDGPDDLARELRNLFLG